MVQPMIRFTLFGVPVAIHPSLWITLALFGGLLSVHSMDGLYRTALFVIAGFFCLLVHEMGHALVGRKLGGGCPMVFLAWLGGGCVNEGAVFTRGRGILMTAAGPLFSLLPGLLALGFFLLYVGDAAQCLELAGGILFGHQVSVVPVFEASTMLLIFMQYMLQISFWWAVLNLIPIFPLDGGQIMSGLMDSERLVHLISLIVAIVLMLLCLIMGFWILAILLGFLAHLNYRGIRQAEH